MAKVEPQPSQPNLLDLEISLIEKASELKIADLNSQMIESSLKAIEAVAEDPGNCTRFNTNFLGLGIFLINPLPKEVAAQIKQAQRIIVTTHSKSCPDPAAHDILFKKA